MNEKNKNKLGGLQYFATKPTEEIGGHLMDMIDEYYDHVESTGRMQLWLKAYDMYYNAYFDGGQLRLGGPHDEYLLMVVNHFKNIILHMHNQTTSARISFEPRASNTDTKSQAQTLLATGLLDYYLSEKRMNRFMKDANLSALLYGEGFVAMDWDTNLGDVIQTEVNENDEGEEDTVREGDVKYYHYTPNNVIRDVYCDNFEDSPWIILRRFENKYELAEQYEEYASEIMHMDDSTGKYLNRFGDYNLRSETESDQVASYILYHKKTKAVPEGRMIKFLDSDLILIDTVLPYDEIPVYREVPEEMEGTTFGSTIAFDLMPIQEMLNILYGIVITNQKTFGVQCIASPRGSNLQYQALAEGLASLEYTVGPNGGKPEPLSLLATPIEIFNHITTLEHQMETISGVNSVVRGNPEASLQSGAALALVHSTAIQFSQSLEQSYNELIQDVGTATIQMLKTFATTKRVVAISGRSNRSYLKEFTSDDISDISRVTVDTGNPLMRTTAGRVQIAENLLEKGLVTTPEEYLQVVNTGRLEPLIEHETAELMNIRSENEAMAENKEVTAVLTDNHSLHIQSHKAVLASPEARNDPKIVEATLAHIQHHMNILMDPANADLLQMLGQQPMQSSNPATPQNPMINAEMQQLERGGPAGEARLPGMPNLPGGEPGTAYNPQLGEAV